MHILFNLHKFKANVDSTTSTVVSSSSIVGVGAMDVDFTDRQTDELTGKFQRVTTGGSFEVINFQGMPQSHLSFICVSFELCDRLPSATKNERK